MAKIKFPKVIRRASECGPFLAKSFLTQAFTIHQGLDSEQLSKVVIVAIIYVEDADLPCNQLLNYYFSIGVDFIVIVVNTLENLVTLRECTASAFKDHRVAIVSRSGAGIFDLDLCLSQLAQKYFCGKWILFCNQYEYLVYPYCESRSLKDLIAYQDSLKEKSVGALAVDCFGSDDIISQDFVPSSLLNSGCYFVSKGYLIEKDWQVDTFSCRVLHRGMEVAPSMQREVASTALVKWRHHYSTTGKMRRVIPKQRNHVFACSKIHVALISFEFWLKSDKFGRLPKDQIELIINSSSPLSHWSCLAEQGLMNLGEWSL
jgi:hypothetical protein